MNQAPNESLTIDGKDNVLLVDTGPSVPALVKHYDELPVPVRRSGFFSTHSYHLFLNRFNSIINGQHKTDGSSEAFKLRPTNDIKRRAEKTSSPLPSYVFGLEDIPGAIYYRPALPDPSHQAMILLSLKKLGKGSFGGVKKVIDVLSGKEYALKTYLSKKTARTIDYAEANLLHELGRYEDDFLLFYSSRKFKHCIISTYLPGHPLSSLYIGNKINLCAMNLRSISQLMVLTAIMTQIVQKTLLLHKEFKLIHCDIKSSNIIFGPDDTTVMSILEGTLPPEALQLNLIDFGNSLKMGDLYYGRLSSHPVPEIEKAFNANRTLIEEKPLPYSFKIDSYCIGKVFEDLLDDHTFMSTFSIKIPAVVKELFNIKNALLNEWPHKRPALEKVLETLTTMLAELKTQRCEAAGVYSIKETGTSASPANMMLGDKNNLSENLLPKEPMDLLTSSGHYTPGHQAKRNAKQSNESTEIVESKTVNDVTCCSRHCVIC